MKAVPFINAKTNDALLDIKASFADATPSRNDLSTYCPSAFLRFLEKLSAVLWRSCSA